MQQKSLQHCRDGVTDLTQVYPVGVLEGHQLPMGDDAT